MNLSINLGECPFCGEDLFLFRMKNHSRLVKCINQECPKQYGYFLPKKGKIEQTGLKCPRSHVEIIQIIPQIITKSKKHDNLEYAYLCADKPCFTCFNRNQCLSLKELQDELIEG